MMDMNQVRRTLEGVTDLPTLPTVYSKVAALVNDPRTTAAQVAKVVETDQAISSKVLRLVNSSFFGFSRRISSIQQAVVLLGYNTIRNTVLSVSIVKVFGENASNLFDLKGFWKHSIGTALLAKLLDRHLNLEQGEESFAAGVLHDLGKLVLSKYFPEELDSALQVAQQEQIPLFEAERKVMGVSHAEVGEYLADRWNLPYGLVESIALHHSPGVLRSNPKLVSLIHVSNIFAREMQLGFNGDFEIPEVDPVVYDELDTTEDDINGYYIQMKEEVAENSDIFNILI